MLVVKQRIKRAILKIKGSDAAKLCKLLRGDIARDLIELGKQNITTIYG